MLKAIIEKLDDVPEGIRPFYTEKDGKFHLQVEGFKTQADVDRVNTALTKERADHVKTKEAAKVATDLAAKFEGIDPEKVRDDLGELETLRTTAKGKPDAAAIEALVAQRSEAKIKAETNRLQRQLNEATQKLGDFEKQNGELSGKLTQRSIDDVVRTAALDAKANPAAINDFLALARGEFQLGEDGTVTTKDGLDVKTFISDQKASRPWLWPSANGAGANGSNGGAFLGDGKPNPFKRESWNLTEQGNMVKADPAAASKAAALAGTTVGGGMPPAPAPKAA